MKNVVVTGVSSGIGHALTRELAGRGYRVFDSVRKQEDAGRLKAELGTSFGPLVFDVTDGEAVLRAAGEVEAVVGDGGLAGLINNAGIVIPGPLMHQPIEEVRAHLETNAIGLVSVTQAFLPLLGARTPRAHPPGRIVNISSTEGKVSSPFLSAFAGSKHAVESVSDSLRRELLPYGIDVVVIGAGPVETGNWSKSTEGRVEAYAGTDYARTLARFFEVATNARKGAYSSGEFARRAADAFEAKRPRTRYAIVSSKLANWTVPSLLPDRLYDRLIGRIVGLLGKPRR